MGDAYRHVINGTFVWLTFLSSIKIRKSRQTPFLLMPDIMFDMTVDNWWVSPLITVAVSTSRKTKNAKKYLIRANLQFPVLSLAFKTPRT
jgi:hypothetical protein